MKSRRKLEKPTNVLSKELNGFSEFFRQNASKIMLGLTLGLLVVVLVRYRNESNRQRDAAAHTALAQARTDLQQLQSLLQSPNTKPDTLGAGRHQLYQQVLADLTEVLGDSDDSDAVMRSEAFATRGDLFWLLANSPPLKEQADTQPAMGLPDTADALLNKAEADYNSILQKYPAQLTARLTAQFGLAAIAENRSKWDVARKLYQDIENDAQTPDMFKQTAKAREMLLDRIREPLLIGPMTTQPTSAPAAVAPTTAPAIVAIPTTAPTTLP